MNYTVIPKLIVNFQTGNSKPVDVYVWATIKCCSNHKTNISHVTEEKLSLLTGLDERTIRRVIKRLKDDGCLTVQTIVKEDADRGFIKRNSYYIKPANKDYFFLDNCFFKKNYPAKIAGFLLLLKAICLNNTDTVQWSNSQIAKAVGLSRNTTTALLNECRQLGLIKAIEKGYELTAGCFINSAVRKTAAGIYKEICEFCKSKGAISPNWDKRAMSVLLTKYNSAVLHFRYTTPVLTHEGFFYLIREGDIFREFLIYIPLENCVTPISLFTYTPQAFIINRL